MKNQRIGKFGQIVMLGVGVIILIAGCNSSQNSSATPTPTVSGGGGGPLPQTASKCEGLSGTLEMQVLVGPAEVVGLEPVAIGSIPFSVTSNGSSHMVQGSGAISYEDVLEEQWGTYTVYFDMQTAVSGTCTGDDQAGELHLTVETSGEQNVEVRAEGFQGDYPWSGTNQFDLIFPVEEGAVAEGEGWAFVLHLNE